MNSKPIIVVAGEPNSIFIEIFVKSLKKKKYKNSIISLGGGAYENSLVRKASQKNAITIWLDTEISLILNRIKKSRNSKRPLLYVDNICFTLNNILLKRKKNYSLAKVKVKVEKTSKKQMAFKVIKLVNEYLTKKDA